MADRRQTALTDEERTGIILAVQSAFTKLKNLYREILPIFQSYGFTAPSPGVIARDLSEKIEASIIQHCASFSKGVGHCDLSRDGHDWEVKICKDSGLTINQSKQIAGENYIVVNYKADSQVTRIWVLWDAHDSFFSVRKPNTNARALSAATAKANVDVLYSASPARGSTKTAPAATAPGKLDFETPAQERDLAVPTPDPRPMMAKAGLRVKRRRQAG